MNTAFSTLLLKHLTALTRAPRTPQSSSHSHARQLITSSLQQVGFHVEEHRFEGPGFDGFNIFTEPIPDRKDLPLLVVGAHDDSVTGSPGADDNASGVAALLALADYTRGERKAMDKWTCRLQLAAYDLEEYG